MFRSPKTELTHTLPHIIYAYLQYLQKYTAVRFCLTGRLDRDVHQSGLTFWKYALLIFTAGI